MAGCSGMLSESGRKEECTKEIEEERGNDEEQEREGI